jgi:hypothetical protein
MPGDGALTAIRRTRSLPERLICAADANPELPHGTTVPGASRDSCDHACAAWLCTAVSGSRSADLPLRVRDARADGRALRGLSTETLGMRALTGVPALGLR